MTLRRYNDYKDKLTIQVPMMPWPGGDQYPKGRTVRVGARKETLFEVSSSDLIRYRKAVRKIALNFHNELPYDSPPYNPRSLGHRDDIMFMWINTYNEFMTSSNTKAIAYGACGFVPPDDHEGEDSWELAWVWIHPYERRRGRLDNAWPYFLERFGLFSVGTPWSVGMKEFLKTHEYKKH